MDQQKKSHDAHARNRQCAVHDSVYVQNYGSGPLWQPGHIVSCEGTVMYQVRLSDVRIVRRHADQLGARITSTEQEPSTSDETLEVASSNGETTEDSSSPDESGETLVGGCNLGETPQSDSVRSPDIPKGSVEITENSSEESDGPVSPEP